MHKYNLLVVCPESSIYTQDMGAGTKGKTKHIPIQKWKMCLRKKRNKTKAKNNDNDNKRIRVNYAAYGFQILYIVYVFLFSISLFLPRTCWFPQNGCCILFFHFDIDTPLRICEIQKKKKITKHVLLTICLCVCVQCKH